MAKSAFDKFMNSTPQGAKKKEMIKVQKRTAKKEARAQGEKLRREKWEKQHGIVSEPTPEIKKGKRTPPVPPTENKPRFGKRPINRKPLAEGEEPTSRIEKKGEMAVPEKKFSKKYITSNSDKYFKGDHTHEPAGAKANRKGEAGTLEDMPLNKFIAHSGVCGRREAAEMVKQGQITVNGDVVYEPGYKVLKTDEVLLKGKKLFLQKNLVYILLNKPKDFITTSSDPEGRKTVMDLVKEATKDRKSTRLNSSH